MDCIKSSLVNSDECIGVCYHCIRAQPHECTDSENHKWSTSSMVTSFILKTSKSAFVNFNKFKKKY
jgi:NAD-dependent dihydropyrimidine dehydrogenase PreA subunit